MVRKVSRPRTRKNRSPNFKVMSDGDDVIRVVSSDGTDADNVAVDLGNGLPLR